MAGGLVERQSRAKYLNSKDLPAERTRVGHPWNEAGRALRMPTVPYCTREDVKSALDVRESARINRQIDRAIRGASDTIENVLSRVFYPTVATIYKDWPNDQYARPWRVWLDAQELISVTAVHSGGILLTAPSSPTAGDGDYFLGPTHADSRTVPPFTYIEMNVGVSKSFSAGTSTWQRSIQIDGTLGYRNDELSAGALNGAIVSTSATSFAITDSASIGVGQLIRVDSERMLVSNKTMSTTGQTLTNNPTASTADVTFGVSDGTKYFVDETLLVDAERILIVDIAGNNLIVKRGYDGTVLAAHSAGATIFALRTLTVSRAFGGTTATTHLDAAPVVKWTPPPLVHDVAIAEAINTVEQETAGYARTVGSGDSVRNASGAGLASLWAKAITAHQRQSRSRVI